MANGCCNPASRRTMLLRHGRSRSLDDKLIVDAPVRPIRDRGDTLQGPLLTVTLGSPMPDIIRVRIEHFRGTLAVAHIFLCCLWVTRSWTSRKAQSLPHSPAVN